MTKELLNSIYIGNRTPPPVWSGCPDCIYLSEWHAFRRLLSGCGQFVSPVHGIFPCLSDRSSRKKVAWLDSGMGMITPNSSEVCDKPNTSGNLRNAHSAVGKMGQPIFRIPVTSTTGYWAAMDSLIYQIPHLPLTYLQDVMSCTVWSVSYITTGRRVTCFITCHFFVDLPGP